MKHIKSTSLAFALIVSTTTILAFQNCSKIAVNDLQPDLGVSGAGSPDIQVGDVPGGHIPQDGDDTGTGGNTGSGDNTGGAGGNTGSNDNPGGTGGNAGNNPGGNDGSDTDHNPGTGSGGDTGTGTGGNAGNTPGGGSDNSPDDDNSGPTPGGQAGNGNTPNPQQPDTSSTDPDKIVDAVINQNSACNLNAPHVDLRGKDNQASGNINNIAVKNGRHVKYSGHVGSISVHGVESVHISGNFGKLCVTAKRIAHLSGHLGNPKTPIVLTGQDVKSELEGVSGNIQADLLIKGLISGEVKASVKKTIISGSSVTKLHGSHSDVYVLHGSNVQSLTGHFRNIYVSSDSTIGDLSGQGNIVPLP